MNKIKSVQLKVIGRVQGVGFRFYAVMKAKDDACQIKTFSHEKPPYDKMAFDHAKILKNIIKEYF